MGQKLYAVLLDMQYKGEYVILTLTTDEESAKEQAAISSLRKVAVIGEMIEEGE